MSDAAPAAYIFPSNLTGRADLAKLLRELELLDNDLEAQRAKHGKDVAYHLPNMSQALTDFIEMNKIDLANDHARMLFKTALRKLKDHAPVVHMTFATETDPQSLQQVVEWVRRELHPQALIQVGLQPSLIGGVYIRTPNHVHDFSLRADMKKSREVLVQDLNQLVRSAA